MVHKFLLNTQFAPPYPSFLIANRIPHSISAIIERLKWKQQPNEDFQLAEISLSLFSGRNPAVIKFAQRVVTDDRRRQGVCLPLSAEADAALFRSVSEQPLIQIKWNFINFLSMELLSPSPDDRFNKLHGNYDNFFPSTELVKRQKEIISLSKLIVWVTLTWGWQIWLGNMLGSPFLTFNTSWMCTRMVFCIMWQVSKHSMCNFQVSHHHLHFTSLHRQVHQQIFVWTGEHLWWLFARI